MTQISWKQWVTCPKCKRDWGILFHKIKITGIDRSEHTCLICGYKWNGG